MQKTWFPSLSGWLAIVTGLLPASWLLLLAAIWSGDEPLIGIASLAANINGHLVALLAGLTVLVHHATWRSDALVRRNEKDPV